ncbi:MAG: substrate-binding domain-containing protein [Prevotella sp.]
MNYSDGAATADHLLKQPIDAIFAFTDTLAIGVMNKSIGRKIPEDIAIAGFSGTEISTVVSPQLTTVEPNQFKMGEQAANLLIKHIENQSFDNEKNIVNADIIYRNSTEQ